MILKKIQSVIAWEILKTPSGLRAKREQLLVLLTGLDDYIHFHATKLRIKPKNVTEKKKIQSQCYKTVNMSCPDTLSRSRELKAISGSWLFEELLCPKTGIIDQQNKATNRNTAWTTLHEIETGLFLIESKTGITLKVNSCTNGKNLSCNPSAPGSPGVLVIKAKDLGYRSLHAEKWGYRPDPAILHFANRCCLGCDVKCIIPKFR